MIRGIVRLALLFAVLFMRPSDSAEVASPPARTIGQWRWDNTIGVPAKVFVDGNRAYVGTDNGRLMVFDITNPTTPRYLFGWNFVAAITGLVVYEWTIFVTFHGTLFGLEFSENGTLLYNRSYSLWDGGWGVSRAGKYIYGHQGSAGILVVDHSKFRDFAPSTGDYALGGSFTTAPLVNGNRAYVAEREKASVTILDVSQPLTPTPIAKFNTAGLVWELAISGNILATKEHERGIKFYDVSNSNAVVPLGFYNGVDLVNPVFVGDRLFVTDRNYPDHGLKILDVSDPLRVTLLNHTLMPISSFAARENHAYVVDLHALRTFDTSGAAPKLVHKFVQPGQHDDDVVAFSVQQTNAYAIAPFSGLQVYNILSRSNPQFVTNLVVADEVTAGAISGTNAFLFSSNSLSVINISNPTAPRLVAEIPGGIVHDGEISGSYAYLAGRAPGLSIYDLSTPTNPTVVATLFRSEEFGRVEIFGTNLYLFKETVRRVDITDPNAPRDLGEVFLTPVKDMDVSGNTLFAVGASGLGIFDAFDPGQPTLISTNRIQSGAYAVSEHHDYAYVSTGGGSGCQDCGQVEIFDVHDPANPLSWGSVQTGGRVDEILPDGQSVFLIEGNGSFKIIERDYRVIRVEVSDQPRLSFGEKVRVSWRTQGDPSDQWELRITCTNNTMTMTIPVVREAIDQWHAEWVVAEPFNRCGQARFTLTELYSRTSVEAFGPKGVLLEMPPVLTLERTATGRALALPPPYTHYGLESAPSLEGPWSPIVGSPRPTTWQRALYPLTVNPNSMSRFYRLKRD